MFHARGSTPSTVIPSSLATPSRASSLFPFALGVAGDVDHADHVEAVAHRPIELGEGWRRG
jgi:hypothetical protein